MSNCSFLNILKEYPFMRLLVFLTRNLRDFTSIHTLRNAYSAIVRQILEYTSRSVSLLW
ncbi:unnamed protein product [Ceutorhynchus assimilis]|uniref:Uncharacterized protein n=1 Tax=Ceutorhynchus assimilis TaxID=467358 RepID=A0A9N9MRX7_9CUCU|nr:unnamed protein product [Ceutorhynchus assimilis]